MRWLKTGGPTDQIRFNRPLILRAHPKSSAHNLNPTRERGNLRDRPSLTLRVMMLWDRLLVAPA